MMNKLLLLGLALAVMAAAHAVPTLSGPSGLASLPTSELASPGQFEAAADYYDTENDSTIPVRVLYGVGDTLEIGALFASSDNDAWGVNAKYALPIDLFGSSLAFGARYITLDTAAGDTTINEAYLVAERDLFGLALDLRGVLGFSWTQLGTGASDESGFRVFLGAEYRFINNLRIGGEFATKSGDLGDAENLTTLYARYPLSDTTVVQAGYTNAGLAGGGLNDSNLFLGISCTFGGFMGE